MSPSFHFHGATSSDDKDLRHFTREQFSEGSMRISLCTEPNYFAAQKVGALSSWTLVARDKNGTIVGTGSVSQKRVFCEGVATRIEYLSGLRIIPQFQKSSLLARGYNQFYQLKPKLNSFYTLTTILESNTKARSLLESGRAGLPMYEDIGRYKTFALEIKRKRVNCERYRFTQLTKENFNLWLEFLNFEGRNRQFFPALEAKDFLNPNSMWQGLEFKDIWLAWDKDDIVGTLALWDQSSFRRWKVMEYNGPLRFLRRPINIWHGLRSRSALPDPGKPLNYILISLLRVANENTEVLDLLLNASLGSRNGKGLFLAAVHEDDPFFSLLESRRFYELTSRLYQVNWQNGPSSTALKKSMCPYLELGTL